MKYKLKNINDICLIVFLEIISLLCFVAAHFHQAFYHIGGGYYNQPDIINFLFFTGIGTQIATIVWLVYELQK